MLEAEMDKHLVVSLMNVLERDRDIIGNNISDREYTDLKEHIALIEDQLRVKDDQLKAKDLQINGLIQSNFNLTKSLNPGQDEVAAAAHQPKGFLNRIFRKSR